MRGSWTIASTYTVCHHHATYQLLMVIQLQMLSPFDSSELRRGSNAEAASDSASDSSKDGSQTPEDRSLGGRV